MKVPLALLAVGLVLAGGSGFLASVALSQGSGSPTRTVTVNVGTGEQGPPGPPGPPGPAGSSSCPTGYEPGDLVINAPGGQVTIRTCLKK